MVGAAIQDYLKVIYKLSLAGQRCTPTLVAERLGVSGAAVTKMVKRLQELNLVNYTRNQELSLTDPGEKIALETIRHHRLLETYLKEALGYTWDQVHSEAERLEHVISEEFEEKIDALLGYPTTDPHGSPIPTREGFVENVRHRSLAQMEPGEDAEVRRVTDRDPEKLRHLARLELFPGTPVTMVEKEPYGGSLRVRVAGVERRLGRELADDVFVSGKEEAA